MSLKKTLFKNTTINMAGYVYLLITALISIPILIRNLGQSQYGIYLIFNSIAPLVSAFDLGLSQASIRYLALPNATLEGRRKVWRSSITGFLLLALAVTIFSSLFLAFSVSHMTALNSVPASTFILMSLVTCAIVFFNHLNIGMLTLPQADQRFDIYNTRVLIIGTTNTLGIALVSYFLKSPTALFVAQLISQVVTFLSLLKYSQYSLDGLKLSLGFDREISYKLFHFGFRQFIGNISNQINFQISKFIIGSGLPAESITYFSVPQNLVTKGAGGVSQLTLALFPMGTALSTKDRLPKLKKLILLLELGIAVLGIVGVIFIYKFGLIVLNVWLRNPDLANACYPILKILGWYFAIAILTPIPTAMSESLNYPHIPSMFAVLTTVVNIILLLVLIPMYGIAGAAYAYLISAILTAPPFILTFAYLLNRYEYKESAGSI